MMGLNLPGGRRESLVWLEANIALWNTNYAVIGLTSAAVIDIAQDIINTRDAFTTVQDVRIDAKTKTQTFYTDADDLHKKASNMIATVKGYAATQTNPQTVYANAGLTQRNPPQPVPAPEQPTDLTANLALNGTVNLTWDGRGPSQTVYEVYRRLSSETEFSLMGVVDARDKAFNDATVPAAQTLVYYQVRAVRGSTESIFSAPTTIQFGAIPEAGEQAA